MEATEEGAGASATTTCGICMEEFPEDGVVKYCDGKHVFCKGCFDGWVEKSLNERNRDEIFTDFVEHYCHKNDRYVCMIPELIHTSVECPLCRKRIILIEDGICENYTGPFSKTIISKSTNYYSIPDEPNKVDDGLPSDISLLLCAPQSGQAKRGANRVECSYLNGKKHGSYKYYYPNGKVMMECQFVNGRIEGSFIYWGYQDQICSDISSPSTSKGWDIPYVNGMINGVATFWWNLDKLWREETYQDGFLHGEIKTWHSIGTIQCIDTFHHGKLVCAKTWLPNGNPKSEVNYTGDMIKHGLLKICHNSGAISSIQHWNNGVICGIYQTFDEEGNLVKEEDFGAGKDPN